MKTHATGIKRLINATKYSINGLKAAYQYEEAFRQETLLLIIGIPAAIYLGNTPIEQVLLIFSLVLIMLVELINSAIEAVVDRIGDEYHPLSGRAKDIGSAAVLVTLFLALLVWIIILL